MIAYIYIDTLLSKAEKIKQLFTKTLVIWYKRQDVPCEPGGQTDSLEDKPRGLKIA